MISKNQITSYFAATAFALASAIPVSAADPSEVKAVMDNVRANGAEYDFRVSGSVYK